ncbi:phosphatase PAP2 family protein [Shewanella donghaensis]|uniref:phosphatase PAP2 family protein n=1 Tax=Shewanella donghaensis TaxID=238836 RepID=UPI0011820980|nr:phosphatase PAP2 family protein [Shewanella donghaensis]
MKQHFQVLKFGVLAILSLFGLLALAALLLPAPQLAVPLSESTGLFLSILTESAGMPYFLITVLIGVGLGYAFLDNHKSWLRFVVQFGIVLTIAFSLKVGFKLLTAEPRPYVDLLVNAQVVDSVDAFYQLSKADKAEAINHVETLYGSVRVSNWLDGTNYSLPSGHSLFVAIFVFVIGGLLLQKQQWLLATMVITWGLGVALSRVYLGMHSYLDIFTSLLCSLISIFLLQVLLFIYQRIDSNQSASLLR